MKCTECGWIGDSKELQTITPRGTHDRCPDCFSVNTADVFIDQIEESIIKEVDDLSGRFSYFSKMESGAEMKAILPYNQPMDKWEAYVREVFMID